MDGVGTPASVGLWRNENEATLWRGNVMEDVG